METLEVERSPARLFSRNKVKASVDITLGDLRSGGDAAHPERGYKVAVEAAGSDYSWHVKRDANVKGFKGSLHITTFADAPPGFNVGVVIVRNAGRGMLQQRELKLKGDRSGIVEEWVALSNLQTPLFRANISARGGLWRSIPYPDMDAYRFHYVTPLLYNGGVGNDVGTKVGFPSLGALRSGEGFSCLVQLYSVDTKPPSAKGKERMTMDISPAATTVPIVKQEPGAKGEGGAPDEGTIIARVSLQGRIRIRS